MAKKNSCKEFDNEKKFLRLENSPPPITFLIVRLLSYLFGEGGGGRGTGDGQVGCEGGWGVTLFLGE